MLFSNYQFSIIRSALPLGFAKNYQLNYSA